MLATYLARFALISYVFAMLATYLAQFALLVSSSAMYLARFALFTAYWLCLLALFAVFNKEYSLFQGLGGCLVTMLLP